MSCFDFSRLTYDIYRYDSGTYCARFCYPADNGGSLSSNFEFSEAFYHDHSDFCSFATRPSYVPYRYGLFFNDLSDGSVSCFSVDLPTVFGYRSTRGKWLRSGAHHTVLYIDFKKLFAF